MERKIVTMGEIMLRLTPQDNSRIMQTNAFEAHYGGAEANVAVSLANLGVKTFYVTQVPNNDIGESAIRYLKANNVDTSYVVKKGNRLGVYFLEKGISIRPSKVIYDRANSAICGADIEDFNFDEIFKDTYLFHISGITPVLSEKCLKLTKKAIDAAQKHNVKISIDLNYRSKLCSYSKFVEIMKELLKDAYLCFGWIDKNYTENFKPLNYNDEIDYDYFKEVFDYMHKEFNIKNVVTTLRKNISSSKNSLTAIASDGENIVTSREYEFDIVDRVGAGDAFAAGVLYKLINEGTIEETIDFGVASSVLKHTIEGDANIISDVNEINNLVDNSSFVIQR